MGRSEMEDHKSGVLDLLLTLCETALALYAMYFLYLFTNHIIPESLIPNPMFLNLLSP
jgi:hypothetical protein